jgi:DNA polymerase III subunit chi
VKVLGEVYFYHLTHSSVAQTLLSLLPRALQQNWRVEVRGVDPAAMDKLDQALWLGPEDGFLPHGLAGADGDALQPVLLTVGPTAGPFACLMAVDGAQVVIEEVQARTRTCILFDGHDEGAVTQARAQWRDLTGAGLAAKYWAQEGEKWVMKQERPAQS